MPTHESVGGDVWALLLLAMAFNNFSDGVQRAWAEAAEEANRAEEGRERFRRYSEDCPSLDEHPDGNAYERLCTDPRHPNHGDPRPQCDRGLCPHLNPGRGPFRGCCGCR